MAKILISLLGTGKSAKGDNSINKYEVTDYLLNRQLYQNKTFVSSAIIEHFGIEKVFFVGTSESMWDNLCELFGVNEHAQMDILEKKEQKKLCEKDLLVLSDAIDSTLKQYGSKCFIVKDGESDEQIWVMFEKLLEILDNLESHDEIYFDITHLFRSVSVLTFIMAELGQISKNIRVSGMFYGLLKKNEPSVIVDLGIFFELLEWAKAIHEMKQFANLDKLISLLHGKINVKELQALERTGDAFNIANMSAVHQSIQNLANHLDAFETHQNKILNLIAPDIKTFITMLNKPKLSDFQFEVAKFYSERHNFALAYIALAEAVITHICEKKGFKTDDKQSRDNVKAIIKAGFDTPYSGDRYKFASQYFNQINKIRIGIAHQTQNTKNPQHDIENFSKYLKESKSYLKKLESVF